MSRHHTAGLSGVGAVVAALALLVGGSSAPAQSSEPAAGEPTGEGLVQGASVDDSSSTDSPTPSSSAAPAAESSAAAAPVVTPAVAGPPARVRVRLKGLSGGKLDVGKKIKVLGTVAPWVAGQKVSIVIRRGNKTVSTERVFLHRRGHRNYGTFEYERLLTRPGLHRIRVNHLGNSNLGDGTDVAKPFSIDYPSLGPGSSGDQVELLKHLLDSLGYVSGGGSYYDDRMTWAAIAFHKVNNQSRTGTISSENYRDIADGKGGFNVRFPDSGKHAEVDISRQVLVLAKGNRVSRIYHVSTGAPATPTVRGTFSFIRREPGYNSHAMYYSTYFYGGYAVHGYSSVPTYNASHGCVRVPIPDAISIYNWIELGDTIHVYE